MARQQNRVVSDVDDLLDIAQAAEFLNVSETSLRRWTNSGQLACVRVGGKRERRFRRADLLAFMELQPQQPADGMAQAPLSSPPTHQIVIGGIPVPYGCHLSGFYATDAGRVQLATAFLADGFRPGSVCYLVAAPQAADEIVRQLDGGPGSELVVSQYEPSGHAQVEYFENSLIAAARSGAHSLRVVGDVSSFAQAGLREELAAYEEAYDRTIARRFPVVTLCLYDVREFSGLDVYSALKGHKDAFQYPVERLLA